MYWKTHSSKTVYTNKWISVREDTITHPSGKKGVYGVVEIPHGVFVIALNEKSEILLVRQRRYCTGIRSWEIPGGGLKSGYTLKKQAREELWEEAGSTCLSLNSIGRTQTQPGVTTQIDHFFVASGSKIQRENIDSMQEEGISTAKFFSFQSIQEMIQSREISHGQSITALMLLLISEYSPKKVRPV